jgi:hypothetical protein
MQWAADVVVGTTWITSGLLSPIACQYQLVRMMTRFVKFFVSASHVGTVKIGSTFEASFCDFFRTPCSNLPRAARRKAACCDKTMTHRSAGGGHGNASSCRIVL